MSESFQIGSSGTSGTGSFIPQQQNMAFVKVGTQDGNSKEALNMRTNTAGSTQSFFAPAEIDNFTSSQPVKCKSRTEFGFK